MLLRVGDRSSHRLGGLDLATLRDPRWTRQGHESRSRPRRAECREVRRAGLAPGPGDQQHVTTAPLVARGRALREMGGATCAGPEHSAGHAIGRLVGDADARDMDPAGVAASGFEAQAELRKSDRDRLVGLHGNAHDLSRVGVQPRRQVDADDRGTSFAGVVDAKDGFAHRSFQRSSQAGTEKSIHHHAAGRNDPVALLQRDFEREHSPVVVGRILGQSALVADRYDEHVDPQQVQLARHDETVSAVVSDPADDPNLRLRPVAPGKRCEHAIRDRASRALHQDFARHAERRNAVSVQRAHFGRAHQGPPSIGNHRPSRPVTLRCYQGYQG